MPSIFVPSHTGRSRPRALTGVTVFALLLVALGSGFLNAQNGNSREIPVVYETLTGKRQGHGMAPRGCTPRIIGDFVETASIEGLDFDCLERLHAMPFFLDFSGPSP